MRLNALTLIFVLVTFTVIPVISTYLGNGISITNAIPIQEEEENHKHYQLDLQDFQPHDSNKDLSLLQTKRKRFLPYTTFIYSSGYLENHCPPPEFI